MFICLIFVLIINIGLTSCTHDYYKKPAKNYYSENIINNFANSSIKKCILLETNIHSQKSLSSGDINTINKFFNTTDIKYFVDTTSKTPAVLSRKPCYKIFLYFNCKENNRYVINVYDSKTISVYPWDGKYDLDYIDMSNTYPSLNLYNLCKSITK